MADATDPGLNPPCRGCEAPYYFDTTIPSELWNRVVRATGGPEYLCLNCIVRAFGRAGVDFTAELSGGGGVGGKSVQLGGGTDVIELAFERDRLREERDKLLAFKTWVHSFLDNIGVPHDPDPEGNARHGCRIGGRMNYLVAELARLRAALTALKYAGGRLSNCCYNAAQAGGFRDAASGAPPHEVVETLRRTVAEWDEAERKADGLLAGGDSRPAGAAG